MEKVGEIVAAKDPEGADGSEVDIDKETDPTEETDETFQDFIRGALVKGASESWTAKYAADAEKEVCTRACDRMDREGVRYRNAEALMEEAADEEWEDLDRARRGAYARRWHLLSRLRKAEQLAYKPRRT